MCLILVDKKRINTFMADNQHRHWILPIHLGGDYRPENSELLSPEAHAEAHRLLWEQHGHINDYVVWKSLLAITPEVQALPIAEQNAIRNAERNRIKRELGIV